MREHTDKVIIISLYYRFHSRSMEEENLMEIQEDFWEEVLPDLSHEGCGELVRQRRMGGTLQTVGTTCAKE